MSRSILTTSQGTNRERFALSDWALFVSISVIWGASFLLIAIGLDAFHPGLITWIRIGSGAGVLMFLPKAQRVIESDDRPRVTVLSFIWVTIPFTLFPIAQQWIDSAVAGMLNGAMPIFAAVIASVMLRKLPAGAQLVGLVVGFVGVVAISAPSLGEGSTQAIGVALVVLATLFYGLSVNIAAPLQQHYGSLPVMRRMLTLATIWSAPYGIYGLFQSSFAWDSLIATLAAGVLGTGLAFAIMGTLVGRVGPTRASFITYAIPVVALVLGVVFRAEQVAAIAIGGVVLVIVGALLASRREG